MKELETIIVPSGNSNEENIRWNSARQYGEKLRSEGKEIRYLITGVGSEGTNNPQDLWNLSRAYSREVYKKDKRFVPIGVDINAKDSIGNIIYSFPKGTEGNYTIISRRGHNMRMKLIEKEARKKNYLSRNLKINYVDTNQKLSIVDDLYDALSFLKFLIFGKRKLRKTIEKINYLSKIKKIGSYLGRKESAEAA